MKKLFTDIHPERTDEERAEFLVALRTADHVKRDPWDHHFVIGHKGSTTFTIGQRAAIDRMIEDYGDLVAEPTEV